jgi:pheromone shutdown protein TraB
MSITKDAVTCRLAATVAARTRFEVGVGTSTGYETGRSDEPSRQAEDEHSQIARANAVLNAFEQPPSAHYRTTTREQHMAQRLRSHRGDGDVVAVVGMGHVEALATRLGDGVSRA